LIDYKKELSNIFKYKKIHYNASQISKDNIAIYGAGKMGKMAIELLGRVNIKPKYIIDKKLTGKLLGINIISPDNISEKDKQSLTFLICIVTVPLNQIKNYLLNIGCKHILHFYEYSDLFIKDIMSNGWAHSNVSNKDKAEIELVVAALKHDEESIVDYLRMLWWRLKRVDLVYPDYQVYSDKKYFSEKNFPILTDNEIYIDAGAHHGQIIEEFIKLISSTYKHVYALEPDQNNFDLLKNKMKLSKLTLLKNALSNKCQTTNFLNGLDYASKISTIGNNTVSSVTIDSLNISPTIIKLHIEGHELEALEGAKQTIEKHRPITMVLADHNFDGLYNIAKYLYNLDDYKLYFHLHDYCGNTSIFYAYPEERLNTKK